ncbi:hypothetical protein D3C76_1361610 [compost metagenome]
MIGQLQPVRVAPEGVDETLPGQLRQVVLAAEMGQHQVLQALPAQLGHQARGLMVVQMSQLATDPLLEKNRVVTSGQPVATMVGFDHQCIEAFVAVEYLAVIRAQVGQQAETAPPVAENVLGRFQRIMRHGHCIDAQGANLQDVPARHIARCLDRLAHPAQRTAT